VGVLSSGTAANAMAKVAGPDHRLVGRLGEDPTVRATLKGGCS